MKNFLVPEMHTVKVSDRDRGALPAVAEALGPSLGGMQDGERHQSSTSKLSPSYASRTCSGSRAFACSWPRSWQMCVNHACFRFQFLHQRQRLFDIGMRGMRHVPQCVENKIVEPCAAAPSSYRARVLKSVR